MQRAGRAVNRTGREPNRWRRPMGRSCRMLLIAAGVELLSFSARAQPADRVRPVVIRGCSVLEVAAGRMQPERTVVLAGGKIQAIGTAGEPFSSPPGALVVAGEG